MGSNNQPIRCRDLPNLQIRLIGRYRLIGRTLQIVTPLLIDCSKEAILVLIYFLADKGKYCKYPNTYIKISLNKNSLLIKFLEKLPLEAVVVVVVEEQLVLVPSVMACPRLPSVR